MDSVVVKVGGSLASHPEKLRGLCIRLSEIAKAHRIIMLPGGADFADTVRKLDKRFSLSPAVSHHMAILGMDQYGLMLSNLTPNSQLTTNIHDLQETSNASKIPVLLPSAFLGNESDLDNSWDVTSDSIAAFLASKLHLKRAILVTDVDGIFECDPKKFPEAKLIGRLSANELLTINDRTAVDRFLPRLLLQLPLPIECFVVNGFYPERIEAILNNENAVCTLITT